MLISKKYGVNPSISNCWLCNKGKEVILFGHLKGDVEAPRSVVMDQEPCEECKELQERGIILIRVRDGSEGSDNPYRTGKIVVLKEKAIKRMLQGDLLETVLRMRYAFVPESAWMILGLNNV